MLSKEIGVSLLALVGTLIIWAIVSLRTLRGMLDGSLFQPHGG